MLRISSILALLSAVVFLVAPAQGGKSSAKSCGKQEFAYAGFQAEETAHGVRTGIAQLAPPDLSDGHVGGWIGVGGTERGPGRRGRVAPGRARGVQRRRPDEQAVLRGDGRRRGADVLRARAERRARRRSTDVAVLEMARAQVVVARLGRRQARSARRSTFRAATAPGTRRRWRRTGTAAPAPATATRYRFTNVTLAHANGGALAAARRQLPSFEDPGLQGRPDLGGARAASSRRACRPHARASVIVSGVPTCISRASFRIAAFGMRMQPCETAPGQDLAARSCRGRRRSRRRASRSASPSARSSRTRSARRTGCRSSVSLSRM